MALRVIIRNADNGVASGGGVCRAQGKVAISEHTHSHQNNIRNGVKMMKGAGRRGLGRASQIQRPQQRKMERHLQRFFRLMGPLESGRCDTYD